MIQDDAVRSISAPARIVLASPVHDRELNLVLTYSSLFYHPKEVGRRGNTL